VESIIGNAARCTSASLLKRDVKALELAINLKAAHRCHVAFWAALAEKTGLARDTVFAALMIVCNGIVGLCLLMGGVRHHEQGFQVLIDYCRQTRLSPFGTNCQLSARRAPCHFF
jgi:hypothetical protein